MVTHCVCYDIAFAELKRIAESTGARTVDELRQHAQFGENCQLCVPYVQQMLETGETAFEPTGSSDPFGFDQQE